MLSLPRKLLILLERRERLKALILLALMVVTAFFEMAGVASIMPFLSVLSNPDIIHDNAWLSMAYEALGFTTNQGFLLALGAIAFFMITLGSILTVTTTWALQRFSSMRQFALSRRLMTDYLKRPYGFFLLRNSSDLAKNVLEESRQVIGGCLMPSLQLINRGLLTLALITFLLLIHPWVAIGLAAALAASYLLTYVLIRPLLNRIGADRVLANKQRFTAAGEAFAGVKEIKLLGRENVYLDRFSNPARRFARHQATSAILSQIPQYAIELMAYGTIILALLVMVGTETGSLAAAIPVIGAYALAGKKLIPAFHGIYAAFSTLRFTMPAVDNILSDLGDRKDSTSLPPRQRPPRLFPQHSLSITELTFYYPGADEPALNHVNFQIPANTTVAFIGRSGAGKSTLVDVILCLLKPDSGKIEIDGTAVTAQNIRNWQASIGYVPQHIFLADDTVSANIALGVPKNELDMQQVIQAAKIAELHDFVTNELPNGYDTIIGDRGVRLSGGQRQRIGIARALYRDPPVLVLDEATSALDNATESNIMGAVHNLSGKKTIIIIAHRLTTIKDCGRIYVLEHGRITAQGTWSELPDIHPEEQLH
ncbi:ABC transporter ATP-binding protein [Ectothiorhodospira marina]|uniref:ABC-type bacteriocin/lantibiotic exporter, contains an N-terminal double-glycine peptidase domain n=1 Tax=Ectothiorhodospira marina TaxID=1396821 RepID=A0A1H7IBE5_9GAMM|nr:ABC transporter ATP-binding protein [Ectothiorhodospira marina]SEK59192.1 ABC-type bacteriocin/lantibiotic exporter, contains an N-terminal double-glycine peptidase domain [Ectothiorhodospira marina]